MLKYVLLTYLPVLADDLSFVTMLLICSCLFAGTCLLWGSEFRGFLGVILSVCFRLRLSGKLLKLN